METIRVLDSHLANQIAAGEVIERPANVVKELVENSIDAKANNIQVYIEEGGLGLIRVVDNGIGMSKEDARLCFYRHATSKIKDDFDLFHINSLGFRGEAIPSIASVSRFSLKTSQGEQGYHIVYEYGKMIEEGDDDGRKGTEMCITQLFQNVPARLKYMRSVNSEFAAIQGYMEKLALSYPNVAFSLYHQSKLVLKTKGNGHLLEVIATIYGLAVAKNMMAIDFRDEEFHVSGYISKLDLTRSNKNYMLSMVNHRVVKNQIALETLISAYRPYLANDRYPIAFLNIDIDPFLVDVNVHPAKLEVRFSKSQQLKELLEKGLQDCLKKQDLTYKAVVEQPKKSYFKPDFTQTQIDFSPSFESKVEHIVEPTLPIVREENQNYKMSFVEKERFNDLNANVTHEVVQEIKPQPRLMKRKLIVKGQVHGTYLICEDEKGMYIIDQHAAKERVNYEYYLEKFKDRDLSLQEILIPITLEYPQSECLLIREKRHLLEDVGVYLEDFGENSFICRKLPLWMKQIDEQLYIEEMVSQLLHGQKIDPLVLQEHAIATLSCKASVKGNTFLDMNNMQHIVDELMCCENPYVCPHGRPTIISYTKYDLEKLFKRVV